MNTAHRSALQAKHAGLDRKLTEEAHRPMPDQQVIADLKKQKLRVKQELEAE